VGASPAAATIDIELTNRCNATCDFCPRDAMPQEGLMRPEVFDQSLARAVEFQALARRLPRPVGVTVTFCGTGEPLVHRRATEYVRRVREAELACQLTTNGSLLSRATAVALLDAGLEWLTVSVSELGADYERVYGLSFARTRDNVEQFIDLARGRCVVGIVVVDHHRDEAHLRAVEDYWRARGVDYVHRYGLINRAGSLRSAAAALPAWRPGDPPAPSSDAAAPWPICPAPFVHLFVGWDGRYYLCSSDWRKEVGFGSVFETSFAAITADKLARVRSRQPICARCTLDPLNLLLQARHAIDPTRSRPLDVSLQELVENDRRAQVFAEDIMATALDAATATAS